MFYVTWDNVVVQVVAMCFISSAYPRILVGMLRAGRRVDHEGERWIIRDGLDECLEGVLSLRNQQKFCKGHALAVVLNRGKIF